MATHVSEGCADGDLSAGALGPLARPLIPSWGLLLTAEFALTRQCVGGAGLRWDRWEENFSMRDQ